MGPAHSTVANKTHRKVCIMTFNNADLVYNCRFFSTAFLCVRLFYLVILSRVECSAYVHKYILEPGETMKIEAASDPIGLKLAIIYDAAPEGQVLYYHRFQARNGTTLTITHIDGADISTFGDDVSQIGKGQIKEKDSTKFAATIEALTYQAPITRGR